MTEKNITTELSPITRVFSEIMKDNQQKKHEENLKHKFDAGLNLMSIRSVAITPDNKYLIITHESNSRIKVIDLSKLEVMPHRYDAHKQTVRLVSPALDSKSFYSASWDGCFMRYDIQTGKHVILFCGTRSPAVFLDPEERYLFTAEYPDDSDNYFNIGRCWDLKKRKTVSIYEVRRKVLYPLGIDIAYDQYNAYMGCDGTMMKFNLKGKKPVFKYFDNETAIRKIAVSENFVVSANCDGEIRVFRKSGEYHLIIKASNYEVKDVKITRDESMMISSSDDGCIKCWSMKNGEEQFSCKAHRSMIWSFCFANDESLIISGGTDGYISFIDRYTGNIILRMYNLQLENEILAVVPKDKNFPNGYFYTSNNNFIDVFSEENHSTIKRLDENDRRRHIYINTLNCKNLVLKKIKPKSQYDEMVNNFFNQRSMQHELRFQNKIKSLGY